MDRNSAPCAILATPISSSRERSSGVATTASVVFPGENGSPTHPARNASSVRPRPRGPPPRSRPGRLLRGDIGHLGGRPERRIPEAQIVDDRRGNDRDHPRGGGEPDAAFLEEAHHSRRGGEPERAPPRHDESGDTAPPAMGEG